MTKTFEDYNTARKSKLKLQKFIPGEQHITKLLSVEKAKQKRLKIMCGSYFAIIGRS